MLSDAINAFRENLPKLGGSAHKGQAGRVLVIGGSQQYTGAPFFAGMSAFRAGADLVTIACHPGAAPALKSYSPDLIVDGVDDIKSYSSPALDHAHAVIVGPGLGRDPSTLHAIQKALSKDDVVVVMDADSLWHVANDTDCRNLVRDVCRNRALPVILTPNVMELSRLRKGCDLEESAGASEVASFFGGRAVVVVKGPEDVISSCDHSMTVSCPGSLKRVGGQGDILAGIIAISAFWCIQAHKDTSKRSPMDVVPTVAAACAITREAARRTFDTLGRATLASDILPFIGEVIADIEKGDLNLKD